jgi:hypothetical protein
LIIGALLSALAVRTRLTVIDALQAGGLLSRISNRQLDRVLSDFDEPTRKQVISVLSQVGALA